MVCQSKRKLKVLDRSQDSTVKPLGLGQWKQHIRNLRRGPTHFMSLSPHQHQYSLHFSLSLLHNIHPAHMSPNAFLSLFSGFSRKNVLTHGKDFLALGLVVRLSRGKFSGSGLDGTCGCVGSHCSLVPLWRLGLEIPLPMPSQHHKSSTFLVMFQAQGSNWCQNWALKCRAYTDH